MMRPGRLRAGKRAFEGMDGLDALDIGQESR